MPTIKIPVLISEISAGIDIVNLIKSSKLKVLTLESILPTQLLNVLHPVEDGLFL